MLQSDARKSSPQSFWRTIPAGCSVSTPATIRATRTASARRSPFEFSLSRIKKDAPEGYDQTGEETEKKLEDLSLPMLYIVRIRANSERSGDAKPWIP